MAEAGLKQFFGVPMGEIKTQKVKKMGIIMFGKQGVGKTTLMQLLATEIDSDKPSSSLNVGTSNFYDETIQLTIGDKSFTMSLTDTIGFKGDLSDNNTIDKMIYHLRNNTPLFNCFILVFARHRIDQIDMEILNIIKVILFEKIKNNLLIVITHCADKISDTVKYEFTTKFPSYKDTPIITVDAPDRNSIDEDLITYYEPKWTSCREKLISSILGFSNSLNANEVFTNKEVELLKARITELEKMVKDQADRRRCNIM